MKTLAIIEDNQRNVTWDMNEILKTYCIFTIKEMNPNVNSLRLQYSGWYF